MRPHIKVGRRGDNLVTGSCAWMSTVGLLPSLCLSKGFLHSFLCFVHFRKIPFHLKVQDSPTGAFNVQGPCARGRRMPAEVRELRVFHGRS